MKTVSIYSVVAVLCTASLVAGQTAPAKPPGGAPPSTTAPKPAAPASKVAAPAAASPVVFPHLHLHVKDMDASRRFWVDALGGTTVKIAAGEAVKLPGTIVFMQQVDPKGASKGSVVDHVAFDVKDVKDVVAKLKKAGFTMATRAETNPVYVVNEDVAFLPDQATSSAVAMAPGDMKVELIENKALATPVAFRHVHFAAPNVTQMKDWYVRAFNAKVGSRGFGFEGVDIGKTTGALMFTLANDKVEATQGRVNDRIGFEVRGLAALSKRLEKQGAKVVRPYGKAPDSGVMSVVVTDPWGTAIELTEGLNKL